MSDKKKDDEVKSCEINDMDFDDRDNHYFHFHESADDYSPLDDGFTEEVDMINDILNEFLSLLPVDMQEYGKTALDAIIASGCHSFNESNKLLKKLRKLTKGRDCPGIAMKEAMNYKALAVESISSGEYDVKSLISKECKALGEYIRYFEKNSFLYDFDDYLFARIERAKAYKMIGEQKGVFMATLEIPEGEEFSMEKLVKGLSAYYEETDDDIFTENSYAFLSGDDNVILIEYNDRVDISEMVETMPQDLRNMLDESEMNLSNSVVTITVDSGKDITSAAMDMQQVLATVCSVYPDSPMVTINGNVIQQSIIPLMIQDTENGFFCEPVLFQFAYDGNKIDEERVFRTHSAKLWGRKDIGFPMPDADTDIDLLSYLSMAISRHVKHEIKAGDKIELDGKTFKAFAYKDGYDDIILLTEKKNDR